MTPVSIREQIQKSKDRILKEIDVPEWDGKIFIRKCDLAEYVSLIEVHKDSENLNRLQTKKVMCRALILSVCDENGNLELTEDDLSWLMNKNNEVIARVYDAILDFYLKNADIKKN